MNISPQAADKSLTAARESLASAARTLQELESKWSIPQTDPTGLVTRALQQTRETVEHLERLLIVAQASGSQDTAGTSNSSSDANSAALVLIVDDDPDGAFMLEQALAKGGYRTDVARDGLAGLARAKQPDVSLVLLDVMLPGLDGFEVCHRLRNEPATAKLPVIMISAKGREEDRATGLRLGANDYMAKPLRLAEVLEKVGSVLKESSRSTHG
jgi:CheY-like chemotaxis protein